MCLLSPFSKGRQRVPGSPLSPPVPWGAFPVPQFECRTSRLRPPSLQPSLCPTPRSATPAHRTSVLFSTLAPCFSPLCATVSLLPPHIPDSSRGLAISSPAAHAPATFVLFQTVRSSGRPSTPPRDRDVPLPLGYCRALLSRVQFPLLRISAAVRVVSRRLPAAPATKAPSR